MSHRIVDACIGCGACRRICPVAAVSGSPKNVHSIDPRLCIDCGACGRVCPKEAVLDGYGRVAARLEASEWVRPVISETACYACENCVEVCPAGALSMKDENLPFMENTAVLSAPEKCVSCGWCFDNCQFDAIGMEASHAGG